MKNRSEKSAKPSPRQKWNVFSSLSRRHKQTEWMDQPGLPAIEHRQALAGLARLNWISGSSRILWPPLRRLSQIHPGKRIRVLDLACGGGDVTVELSKRARRSQSSIEFVACDVSELALAVGRKKSKESGLSIEFFQADVLAADLPGGFDAVMCSLFLHHLTDIDAEGLLRRMGQTAGTLVLVNDLVRSPLGYLLAQLASRLLTRSAIVQSDGPVSVEAAFTPTEALDLARRAGWSAAKISRHWPQRFLLQWWKK
jgi:2-polyprenyl-3-methyl-5-hydroxy-6-metoxy-1,4-benzoquinol methylase